MSGPVVVLTALDIEYRAVRSLLDDVRRAVSVRGTLFETGTVCGGRARVLLAMTGKGNHTSAVLAERAIERFDPRAVLFVGIAGALWDTAAIGDVVVGTHIYAYHGGTSDDDGFATRPRAWELSHSIIQLAAHVDRAGIWRARLSTDANPRVHQATIAAGEVVQNSRLSAQAQHLRQHYNDALAIEMESAGLAQAGALNGTAIGVVRAISDRADGTKDTAHDHQSQPRAAANAAAFAVALAEEIDTDREDTEMTLHRATPSPTTVTNTAHGTVGVQAGSITGSTVTVTHATPATPLTTEQVLTDLAVVRTHLTDAHSAGDLDNDTFDAARAEIDTVDESLRSVDSDRRPAGLLALKRLRGLVTDVAGVAPLVTMLITATQALQ